MDGGVLGGILFLVFLILKLTGNIAWSWLWVLSPIWIDAALTLLVVGVFAFFGVSIISVVKRAFRNVYSSKQELEPDDDNLEDWSQLR